MAALACREPRDRYRDLADLAQEARRAATVSLDEAVREALCFGWIDSTLRPLDETRSQLLFTPRRAGSTWSRPNKLRVADLVAQGMMAEAGLRVVKAAKRDGSWDALDTVEALQIPQDLAQALAANAEARENFDPLAPSAKKQYLWWIESAKRPGTRASRIEKTVQLAAMNRALTDQHRP